MLLDYSRFSRISAEKLLAESQPEKNTASRISAEKNRFAAENWKKIRLKGLAMETLELKMQF